MARELNHQVLKLSHMFLDQFLSSQCLSVFIYNKVIYHSANFIGLF